MSLTGVSKGRNSSVKEFEVISKNRRVYISNMNKETLTKIIYHKRFENLSEIKMLATHTHKGIIFQTSQPT